MADIRHCLCILFISCIGYAYGQKPSPIKRAQTAYIEAGKALRLNQLDQARQQLLLAISYDANFANCLSFRNDLSQ